MTTQHVVIIHYTPNNLKWREESECLLNDQVGVFQFADVIKADVMTLTYHSVNFSLHPNVWKRVAWLILLCLGQAVE